MLLFFGIVPNQTDFFSLFHHFQALSTVIKVYLQMLFEIVIFANPIGKFVGCTLIPATSMLWGHVGFFIIWSKRHYQVHFSQRLVCGVKSGNSWIW